MKKDKLYTVNRWNANIFWPGGDMDTADKGIINYSGGSIDNPYAGMSMSSKPFGSMITNPSAKPLNPYGQTSNSYTGDNSPNYGYTINGQSNVGVGASDITSASAYNKNLIPTFTDWASQAVGAVTSNKEKPVAPDVASGVSPAKTFMDKYGGIIGAGVSMFADALPFDRDKYKRGAWDAADPVYHLAGGHESGIGNAVSDVGVGLTKAGLSTGNFALAGIGAGAKVLGGLWNGAFGTKWNNGLIDKINTGSKQMRQAGEAFGQAKTSSDFFNAANLMGNKTTFGYNDLGSTGWFRTNNALKRKARTLNNRQNAAAAYQSGNMQQAANKIDRYMDDIAMKNGYAFGGLLGNNSGALGLMQQNNALTALQQQTPGFKKGVFGSMFAEGGYKPTTFIDNFSADPIGTVVNYRNMMDQRALAQQLALQEEQRAAEYSALQDSIAALETQNKSLQTQLSALPTAWNALIPQTPIETTSVSPVEATPSISPSAEFYSQALAGTRGKNKTWDYVEDQLRRSGKFNDIQLLGIKSNLERESGMNWNVIGDNGAAYGLGQWHGSRQPKDRSLAGQTNLLLNSLSTFDRNHWLGKNNYEGFVNARTPEEAHYYLAAGYERPKKSIIAKLKRESDESLKHLKAMGGNLFAEGGSIEIKHPGRLTELKERTGKTEAELWAEGKPEVRKMITFARNARKWQKAYGGYLDATKNLFDDGGPIKPQQRIENGIVYDERPREGVSSNNYRHVGDVNSTYAEDAGGNVYDYSTKLPEVTVSVDNRNIQEKMRDAYGGLGRNPKYHSNSVERQIKDGYNFFWPGAMRYAPTTLASVAGVPFITKFMPETEGLEEFPGLAGAAESLDNMLPWGVAGMFPLADLSHKAGMLPPSKSNRKALGGSIKPTNNIFALGGDIQNHGADWTNGLTVIDTGDSHEANPMGGVQMGVDNQGVPNLVEEGETVYNDYVYSNRLEVPDFMKAELGLSGKTKKKITFADASKQISKESEQRPNDPISKRGLQASMAKLAQAQEAIKTAEEYAQEENSYALGGRVANIYDGKTQKSQKITTSSRNPYTTVTATTPQSPAPVPNSAFGYLGTTPLEFPWAKPLSIEDTMNGMVYKPKLEVAPFELAKSETPTTDIYDSVERVQPPLYQTWMRYVPAVGTGLAALTDTLGWTNKPDYTYADKLEAMANRAGYAPQIDYKPVGQYRRYNPMDIWYAQNRMDANARATDRALINHSGPVGTKAAGLLANGYNNQASMADLYSKALAYNDTLQNAVATFNRGTDMFDSQQDLAASEANARYRQTAWQYGLNGLAQAAAMRNAIDQRVGAARSANITNLLTSLGNIGRENFAMNQINTDRSRHYYGTLEGDVSGYKRRSKKYNG